jgi:cytochrome d ubiquinol oxidase subunit II
MSLAGFAIVAFMLAAYVVLDGYDLGVAAVSLGIARNDAERAAAMDAIGPFWNGNEVWLIAAGGVLFMLFPLAYASSFSGFYLPFMVVLWLLMFRGIAIELRGHMSGALWHQFWDAAFSISSGLLILLFGVALGNLVRGVPLDHSGYFQGTFSFLLNPYALLVGIFAVAVLLMHGATFLSLRIAGDFSARARKAATNLWWVVLVLDLGVSVATFAIGAMPGLSVWLTTAGVLSLGALAGLRIAHARKADVAAFAFSSAFIVLLLVVAAGTLYPYMLPGYPDRSTGLSIFASTPNPLALDTAIGVSIAGLLVVLLYGGAVTKAMAQRISVE